MRKRENRKRSISHDSHPHSHPHPMQNQMGNKIDANTYELRRLNNLSPIDPNGHLFFGMDKHKHIH